MTERHLQLRVEATKAKAIKLANEASRLVKDLRAAREKPALKGRVISTTDVIRAMDIHRSLMQASYHCEEFEEAW